MKAPSLCTLGENSFPHCVSLPISAAGKTGVPPRVLSTNGDTHTHRFQHVDLNVWPFSASIHCLQRAEVELTSFLSSDFSDPCESLLDSFAPLSVTSCTQLQTEFFKFVLKKTFYPAQQVQSRKTVHWILVSLTTVRANTGLTHSSLLYADNIWLV